MAGLAPGPYLEPGPDGRIYFKLLRPYLALADSYAQAFAVRRRYQSIPHPEAKLKADLVGKLIRDMSTEVAAGEIAVAKAADKAITARIRATQHRPKGKGLLVQKIKSHAIPTTPFPTGAVGIAEVALLDEVVDEEGRAYWRAQEWGSAHRVAPGPGRGAIVGFFQPGNAGPDPTQFRVHPIFQTEEGGARTVIQRPIPERGFLRRGTEDAEVFRYRLMTRIAGNTVKEIEGILAVGGAPGTTRRVGRREIRL